MAEVKNTKKKPTAKKPAQNAADTPVEKLDTPVPEAAPVAEQAPEQAVAEKPVKKKSVKKSTKTTISDQQGEAVASDETKVEEEKPTDEPVVPEQPAEQTEQPAMAEEKLVVADEPKAEDKAAEVKATPAAVEKPAKDGGKKFTFSKNMIIILSCVLAVVLIGIILAVTLTSCKSDNADSNKKYTVTFMVDGEVMTSYTLKAGETISRPKTDPDKEMFTFDGWYLVNPNNSSQKQKFVFDTKISQNITLVAIFSGETNVKVEFDPNGGAFENNKKVELLGLVGAFMSEPEDEPTRFGYVFDGWYTEAECYNKFSFDVYPITDFTLYAKWDKDADNFVYISYYGNDELLRVDPVRKDDTVVLPDLFGDQDDIVVGDWLIENNPNKPYTAGKATTDLNLYVSYYTDGLVFSTTRTEATVTGYNGTAQTVIVPSTYNDKPVINIGNDAFYRTSGLPAVTSVKLPDTITRIGSRAFYDCQYLVSVNLTYKVTSIGADAFYRNTRLRMVGDISGVEGDKLGAGAFNGCKELREISLGNLLTKIDEYTFNDCSSLAQVNLPDALTEIGEYAFSGCTALKSVALESLVLETIADNAFAGCSSLTEVVIHRTGDEVTMQGNPFADCRNVTVYVPSTLLEAYKNNTNNTQFKDKLAAR